MSAISLKSITGITSITSPAAPDNQITLHTQPNTVERLRIDSSGRLLIGTTTEGHGNADDLTIATTDHTGITLRSATNRNGSVFFSDGTSGADEYRGWIQYTHTSDYLTFGTAANEGLRITSTGLLQGTSYQHDGGLELLSSNNNQSTRLRIQSKSSGGTAYNWYLDSARSVDRFTIHDGTTSWFTILGTGKVGINNTSPSNALDVQAGTTNTAIVARSTDAKAQISLLDNSTTSVGSVAIGAEGDALFLTSGSAGAEALRIASTGQVQINRDGGSAALTLGASQDFRLYHDAGGPTIFSDNNNQGLKLQIKELNLTEYTGATTRLKITSSGRVGINTTTDSMAGVTGNLNIANDNFNNHTVINLSRNTTADRPQIRFQNPNGNVGYIGTFDSDLVLSSGNDLIFRANGTEKVRIKSDGRIDVGGNENAYKFNIIDNSNRTTTAETALLLYAKHDGSGTTGAGFGTGIRFWGDRASGNVEQNMGRIMCTAEVNSGTTLSGALSFETSVAGSLAERLRIASDGIITQSATHPQIILKDPAGRQVSLRSPSSTNFAALGTDTGHDLIFYTNGYSNERLRITYEGQLTHTTNKASGYIATFNQAHADNTGSIQINSPTDNNIRPTNIDLAQAGTVKWSIGQVYASTSDRAFHICSGGNSQSNSKFVLTTAGLIGVGTINPGTKFHLQDGDLTIKNSGECGPYLYRNNGNGPDLVFHSGRGSSFTSPTASGGTDLLGNINFAGYDGSTYHRRATINGTIDGTVSSNTVPTALIFRTGSTSATERLRITSSGNIEWKNRSVKQRKGGAFLGISGASTSDIKICGNFGNNNMIRVRWAYNWNAGNGGAWGEAVIWMMYQGTKQVRYVSDIKASPLTSVSFPHSGNDVWLRWTTNAGINGWYMIDVETHGCEPFPF